MASGRSDSRSVSCCSNPCSLEQTSVFSEVDNFLVYDSSKNRFFWNGTAADLEKFIEHRLIAPEEDGGSDLTASSNDHCAVFKTPSATFNFYLRTKTLQVQGKASGEMKNILLEVVNSRTKTTQSDFINGDDSATSTEETRLEDNPNSSDAIIMEEAIPSHPALDEDKVDLFSESCNCRNEIHKLWIAVESINSHLKTPTKQVSMIEHELNQYKLKCAMYEDKLKKLEEEKVCLLESLRILSTAPSTCPKVSTKCVIDDDHQESPGGSNTMNANHERSTQGKRSKNSPNGTTQKNSRSSKSARQPTKSAVAKRSSPNPSEETSTREHHSTSAERKPVTVICGDSIVQNVRGWKISASNKVVLKSFSGATTSDMEDYLKPITRKCPDSLVLHVGTNDLLSIQTSQQIAESIVNLADQIESDSPGTLVSISAICVRKEDELWKKATAVNKLLRRFCSNRRWGFLPHNNIESSCLNASGLHLNRKGVSILSDNFLTHIDGI